MAGIYSFCMLFLWLLAVPACLGFPFAGMDGKRQKTGGDGACLRLYGNVGFVSGSSAGVYSDFRQL